MTTHVVTSRRTQLGHKTSLRSSNTATRLSLATRRCLSDTAWRHRESWAPRWRTATSLWSCWCLRVTGGSRRRNTTAQSSSPNCAKLTHGECVMSANLLIVLIFILILFHASFLSSLQTLGATSRASRSRDSSRCFETRQRMMTSCAELFNS